MHTNHVTPWEQRTGLSTSTFSVLQGSSWQTLATTCGWPTLVAIPTPENMWQSILRNPDSGNTGNDGDGNGTGSSVAHVLVVQFLYDESKVQVLTPAYRHDWPLGCCVIMYVHKRAELNWTELDWIFIPNGTTQQQVRFLLGRCWVQIRSPYAYQSLNCWVAAQPRPHYLTPYSLSYLPTLTLHDPHTYTHTHHTHTNTHTIHHTHTDTTHTHRHHTHTHTHTHEAYHVDTVRRFISVKRIPLPSIVKARELHIWALYLVQRRH